MSFVNQLTINKFKYISFYHLSSSLLIQLKKDLSNQYAIVNLSIFLISKFLFAIQIFPQNSELIRVVNSPPWLFPKPGMLEKKKKKTEIVLHFVVAEETASENVVSPSKYFERFDTYLVDLLAGFNWITGSTADQNQFIIMFQN